MEKYTYVKMYDMPLSLQECCVDFICDNWAEQSIKNLCLNENLSEHLLTALCQKGKLTDETLALFDSERTALRRVSIHRAPVTLKGLRVLKGHRISELELTGLKNVTVNDIIGYLGEWTLSNLRMLNVSSSTVLNSATFCVVVALAKLRNLHSLNVGYTELNKHGLEIIAEDLPCLESLDISGTPISDIAPLRKCRDRLKVLVIYNLMLTNTSESVSILCELHHLRLLDLSSDYLGQGFVRMQPLPPLISTLLQKTRAHPLMTSLDISGREELSKKCLADYLKSHPPLRFLGLALTKACEYNTVSDKAMEQRGENMRVSGEGSLKQLMESMRRYNSRSAYVQKTFSKLYDISTELIEPRHDIIQAMLPCITTHPKDFWVQHWAVECLKKLTMYHGRRLHPSCIKQVVTVTLDAMENFDARVIQGNGMLILNIGSHQNSSFDRYRCALAAMKCLCTFEDDDHMRRMSVVFFFVMITEMSAEQKSSLGSNPRYMKKLLQLVKGRTETRTIDPTLTFTLSALWNLTDRSPPTCSVFLGENGLELFMMMLQMLEEKDDNDNQRVQVETKILGLLTNIAELKTLRHQLMRTDFITLVKRLLATPEIGVSYFVAGIVAHLASDGEEAWRGIDVDRDSLLEELTRVVMGWQQQPQGVTVAYRSFSPFLPLLDCVHAPSVQLWALWAIRHVCTRDGERYCPLLHEEGGVEKIQRLRATYPVDTPFSKISANILDRLAETKSAKV